MAGTCEQCESATVMVVDDERDIRDAVRDVLEEEGYRVIPARDGKEALDEIELVGKPCVLLLDLMMPRMNGWQLLEALRRSERTRSLPVVLVTASDDRPPDVQGALGKPFDLNGLLSAIERWCPHATEARAPA